MEEQRATDRAEKLPSISIAGALNTSMKTISSLVAKYTAAVQATAKPLNGEARFETEGPSQRKSH
jgi:hypothetical protein